MTYTDAMREFPDYPRSDLPPMPEGFSDYSWHNDVCPRIGNGNLWIILDYADATMREVPGLSRFFVCHTDGEEGSGAEILSTDDWSEVLALLPIL